MGRRHSCNDDPKAENDTVATLAGTAITVSPLINDGDPDGDSIGLSSVGVASNGSVVLNDDGTVTYTPDADFTGTDSFEYTITDSDGNTDTATVTVTVASDDLGSSEHVDTDIFPVSAAQQVFDPFNGLDEDSDTEDNTDTYNGNSDSELIETGDDADTINAQGGNDTIYSGVDDDSVRAGSGDDLVVDTQGADTIYGNGGDDTILARVDTFSDYVNDDPVFVSSPFGFDSDPNTDDGRDYVNAGAGDDLVYSGDDADTILGESGDDTIYSGIDDDSVDGGSGDDMIFSGHGSDTVNGGSNDDYIDGGLDDASLELDDSVDVNTENDRDYLDGEAGEDTIFGGDDDDTLYGGSDDDYLDGGIDDDSIFGESGDDLLFGGDGDDTVQGGSDKDTIYGGAGDDSIQGDSGNDALFAGTGENYLEGGADRDTLYAVDAGDFLDGSESGSDYDILNLAGAGKEGKGYNVVIENTYLGGGNITYDGIIEFLDGDGNVSGTSEFKNIEKIVPCFTPGTLIATPTGERLVETLNVGDRIITRDNGIQEIRWIGSQTVSGGDFARNRKFCPVLIEKGALGNGLPEQDMLVSPNHRVLISNEKTVIYLGEREVLVAAKHLTDRSGIHVVTPKEVTYIHFMFDQHEVVLSNGAWTESFQPGDYTLGAVDAEQRKEILQLFPELETVEGVQAYTSARRSLRKHEAALIGP